MKLRRARLKDTDFLLSLRNDPESLKRSWVHEPVSRESYEDWLRKAIYFNEPRVYVAEESGIGLGTIKVEQKDSDEISFTVASKYRGYGYGTEMLKAIKPRKGIPLVAYMDMDNIASIKAFKKAGFTLYVHAVKHPVKKGK